MAFNDKSWQAEIAVLDAAVSAMLTAKRTLREVDPEREHVLHMRHIKRLRDIKRQMDAICW